MHILHIQDDSLDIEYPATNNTTNIQKSTTSLTDIFENCILSSFEIQGKIGGYIIIFSCISGLFIQTLHLNPFSSLIFNSILEISSGLGTYNSFALNNHYISLVTALTSFGGICTLCQMFSCMKNVKIPKKCLVYSKLLSGILAYTFTYIFLS